jgi:hypothetical protein
MLCTTYLMSQVLELGSKWLGWGGRCFVSGLDLALQKNLFWILLKLILVIDDDVLFCRLS